MPDTTSMADLFASVDNELLMQIIWMYVEELTQLNSIESSTN